MEGGESYSSGRQMPNIRSVQEMHLRSGIVLCQQKQTISVSKVWLLLQKISPAFDFSIRVVRIRVPLGLSSASMPKEALILGLRLGSGS